MRMINLKMLSLRWMLQDGNQFCDLVSKFSALNRPSWFGHPLLIALFKTHWRKTRRVIVTRGLLPFVIYFCSCLIFTQQVATSEDGKASTGINDNILVFVGLPLFLGWGYFSYFEM